MTTNVNSFTATLDHLILAVGDLEKGVAEFTEKTGIKPTYGGVHQGIGTHNALVALGSGMYLEILAPENNGGVINGPFGQFDDIETLTPIGWVVGINDFTNLLPTLDQNDIIHSGIQQMSRKKSDGSELAWSTVFLLPNNQVSINPFFIEWDKNSEHPSASLPEGCLFKTCTMNLIKENPLSNFLQSLSLDTDFQTDTSLSNGQLMKFGIDTPKGYVEFTSK